MARKDFELRWRETKKTPAMNSMNSMGPSVVAASRFAGHGFDSGKPSVPVCPIA